MNPIEQDPTVPNANRRRLLLAGAGAGGVLLGAVFLASVSAGPDVPPPPVPTATTTPVAQDPEPPPAGLDPELAFAVGRDPFEQLVTAPEPATGPDAVDVPVPAEVPLPAPAPAPAPPAPAPPAGTDTPPPAGAVAPETTPQPPAPAPAPDPAPAPAPAPADEPHTPGYWYFPPSSSSAAAQQPSSPSSQRPPPEVLNDPEQLKQWMFEHMRFWSVMTDDAGARRAFITIDDRAYFPTEGQPFADHFRLESIEPDCIHVSASTLYPGICVPAHAESRDPGKQT